MSAAAKWTVSLAVVLCAAILALYLRQADLAGGEETFLPRCGLNHFTGLHCPGCGNTRATYALLHGDIAGAVRQNALFVVALPFLLFGAARTWYGWMFPGKLRPLFPFDWRWSWSLVLVGIVVLFTVLRNLPVRPFSWLAPVSLPSDDGGITGSPIAGREGPGPGSPPSSPR